MSRTNIQVTVTDTDHTPITVVVTDGKTDLGMQVNLTTIDPKAVDLLLDTQLATEDARDAAELAQQASEAAAAISQASEQNASASATLAGTHLTAAEQAQTAAETAQSIAETARDDAQASATAAGLSEDNASLSQLAAEISENNAKSSELLAEHYASTANAQNLKYLVVSEDHLAISREGLIADSSIESFTITLPGTPLPGDSVVICDGADWSSKPVTVESNGKTIEGAGENLVLDVGGVYIFFLYTGDTWKVFTQGINPSSLDTILIDGGLY